MRVDERPLGVEVHLRLESFAIRAVHLDAGDGCSVASERREVDAEGRIVLLGALDCPDGMQGARVGLRGLEEQQVLLFVTRSDGTEARALLSADEPSWTVREAPSFADALGRYVQIGARHVAEGFDHLLFLFALLLVTMSARAAHRARIRLLLVTVTGFTLGHAITITAAGLGWANLASAPVELTIALSIAWLAAELIRDETAPSLTRRMPWAVAAGFGLLHGLGFAGALREVGVQPEQAIASLVGFNVGVELAQVAAVALMYGAATLLGAGRHASRRRALAYVVGTIAVVLVLTRVSLLVS